MGTVKFEKYNLLQLQPDKISQHKPNYLYITANLIITDKQIPEISSK
jgi:hypothetical protein